METLHFFLGTVMFSRTLPDETREIKLIFNIRYDPFLLFCFFVTMKTIFGGVRGGNRVIIRSSVTCRVSVLIGRDCRVQTGVGGRGRDASSPASSSSLYTVETGVGVTAAFLVSGRGLCDKGKIQIKSVIIFFPAMNM